MAPYAVLLRWRLKPGRYEAFAQAWEAVTLAMLAEDSLGSTLFEAADGTVHALARWPDKATRERAFADHVVATARKIMADAIEEALPEVELTERINLWVPPK